MIPPVQVKFYKQRYLHQPPEEASGPALKLLGNSSQQLTGITESVPKAPVAFPVESKLQGHQHRNRSAEQVLVSVPEKLELSGNGTSNTTKIETGIDII